MLDHFKNTFEECREAFLELARKSGGELRSDLFDSLYLPPKSGEKKKLLILTSGIHGIEGFTGSALQRHFLSSVKIPDDLGVLIIHGINPYGFKNFRRVTENNVDLNRNFDLSPELFKNTNPGYDKVNSFLNPGFRYSRLAFYPKAIAQIFMHGMDNLRKAILRGHYQYPKGIFFGGKDFEPQVGLIRDELTRVSSGYEKVLLVDLHTGYGQRGKLHLFGDRAPTIDPEYMKEVFGDLKVEYGAEKDFYSITGGFTVFVSKLLHGKAKFAGVVFEFGTIDSHTPRGSLESLYRMINENQKDRTEADKKDFLEMFYPSDPVWRVLVPQQFDSTLKEIFRYLHLPIYN
ncbi:MAG: M14 family metallopeptidase [Bdellovibrionota bacterium]